MQNTYQELRRARTQIRNSISALYQDVQAESEFLRDVELELSSRFSKLHSRTSLRSRLDSLLKKAKWERKAEWTRKDIQKVPEFAGDNAVSLNVLLYHLCNDGRIVRVQKGVYRCA